MDGGREGRERGREGGREGGRGSDAVRKRESSTHMKSVGSTLSKIVL